jgi:hypothetical protein
MPDSPLKPTQNDAEVGFIRPEDDPQWQELPLSQTPPYWPQLPEWDDLNPRIDGMVVTFAAGDLLKVMCGGLVYEINWANLWPPTPVADPAPGACDPRRDTTMRYIHRIVDIEWRAHVRQTPCVLQINCVLAYTIVEKTMKCNRALKRWRQQGNDHTYTRFRTRANFFTCPCGE